MSKFILEPQIKSSLINYLYEKDIYSKEDCIINEFNISNSSRRVDLALVKEEKLLAFEIKSNSDSLTRLEGQVSTYLDFFDKVTVVSAPKHIEKILKLTNNNVAVWEINENNKIKIVRRGKFKKLNNKKNIVKMLTIKDILRLLKVNDVEIESSRRISLENKAVNLPLKTLRRYLVECIKSKYSSTNELFNDKTHSREATPEDLKLLRVSKKSKVLKSEALNLDSFINALSM